MSSVSAGGLFAAGFLLPMFSILAVVVRFVVRYRKRHGFRMDDYMCVPAALMVLACGIIVMVGSGTKLLGQDVRTAKNQSALLRVQQIGLAFDILQTFGLASIKISVLFLYRRLLSSRGTSLACVFVGGFVVQWFLTFIVSIIVVGIRRLENPGQDSASFAADNAFVDGLLIVLSVENVLVNIAIYVLPIPGLARQQLLLPRLLKIVGVFLFAGMAIAFGILQLALPATAPSDPLASTLGLLSGIAAMEDIGAVSIYIFWGIMQLGMLLIAICLPTWAPLLSGIGTRKSPPELSPGVEVGRTSFSIPATGSHLEGKEVVQGPISPHGGLDTNFNLLPIAISPFHYSASYMNSPQQPHATENGDSLRIQPWWPENYPEVASIHERQPSFEFRNNLSDSPRNNHVRRPSTALSINHPELLYGDEHSPRSVGASKPSLESPNDGHVRRPSTGLSNHPPGLPSRELTSKPSIDGTVHSASPVELFTYDHRPSESVHREQRSENKVTGIRPADLASPTRRPSEAPFTFRPRELSPTGLRPSDAHFSRRPTEMTLHRGRNLSTPSLAANRHLAAAGLSHGSHARSASAHSLTAHPPRGRNASITSPTRMLQGRDISATSMNRQGHGRKPSVNDAAPFLQQDQERTELVDSFAATAPEFDPAWAGSVEARVSMPPPPGSVAAALREAPPLPADGMIIVENKISQTTVDRVWADDRA